MILYTQKAQTKKWSNKYLIIKSTRYLVFYLPCSCGSIRAFAFCLPCSSIRAFAFSLLCSSISFFAFYEGRLLHKKVKLRNRTDLQIEHVISTLKITYSITPCHSSWGWRYIWSIGIAISDRGLMISEVASLMLQLYSIRLAIVISVLLMLALFLCNQARGGGGMNSTFRGWTPTITMKTNIGLQQVFSTLDPNKRENKHKVGNGSL